MYDIESSVTDVFTRAKALLCPFHVARLEIAQDMAKHGIEMHLREQVQQILWDMAMCDSEAVFDNLYKSVIEIQSDAVQR